MSYSDKLLDPRWQKVRLKVFERAGWKCEACNECRETLVVHHLVYSKKEPWDSPLEELECLCKWCHVLREQFNDWIEGRTTAPTLFILFLWNMLNHAYRDSTVKWNSKSPGWCYDFLETLLTARYAECYPDEKIEFKIKIKRPQQSILEDYSI